jgi:hypothetical protein
MSQYSYLLMPSDPQGDPTEFLDSSKASVDLEGAIGEPAFEDASTATSTTTKPASVVAKSNPSSPTKAPVQRPVEVASGNPLHRAQAANQSVAMPSQPVAKIKRHAGTN